VPPSVGRAAITASSVKGALPLSSNAHRGWRHVMVGLPKGFRLRLAAAGRTLPTRSSVTQKDTMARAGQSSEKAPVIYRHADDARRQDVAGGIDARVRAVRDKRR
jgi:hypothetical protein